MSEGGAFLNLRCYFLFYLLNVTEVVTFSSQFKECGLLELESGGTFTQVDFR